MMKLPFELLLILYELFPCDDGQTINIKYQLLVDSQCGSYHERMNDGGLAKYVNRICFFHLGCQAAVNAIGACGQLNTLKYLWREGHRTEFNGILVSFVISNGQTAILDWLEGLGIEIFSCSISIATAAGKGHLAMLQWFEEREQRLNEELNASDTPLERFHEILGIDNTAMDVDGMDNISFLSSDHDGFSSDFDSDGYDAPDFFVYHHQHRLYGSPNSPDYSGEEFFGEGISKLAMDRAAANGHLEIVQWINENYTVGCTTEAMDGAAFHGHLEMVKWLHQNCTEGCTRAAMDGAAKNGHLEVVKWLHESRTEGCSAEAMDQAAANGHLDVVKWLHENRPEGCTTEAMDSAAKNGHLVLVKWLHENRLEGCRTRAMDLSASENHLDIVKFLHENRNEGCTTYAMDNAAANGHFEMLKYLQEHRIECCTIKALDSAVQKGREDIANWLRSNVIPRESCRNEMNSLARKGNLEGLKWLHQNHKASCTKDAMDGAAAQGHLEIVKWLHYNRAEGCTTKAMDNAAGNGHIEIVKFLHQNRREGCTKQAMDLAAENGHMGVVWWLHNYRRQGCTRAAMDGAAKNGHLEVVKWLYYNRNEGCTKNALLDSAARGHIETMKFLCQTVKRLSNIPNLLKGDRRIGRARIRDYLVQMLDYKTTRSKPKVSYKVTENWLYNLQ